MEIVTPRLTLRPAGPDDLEAMHAVLSDPRAVQWWSTPPHETLDQTRDWLEAMISANGSGLDFLIEVEGRVVGKAGFYAPPDVGYILHPDVWGRGLATEAVGAVLDRLFETTDHAMATADVDPANAASIRLDDTPDILAELATVEMHAIQTSGNCIRNISSDHMAGAAADAALFTVSNCSRNSASSVPDSPRTPGTSVVCGRTVSTMPCRAKPGAAAVRGEASTRCSAHGPSLSHHKRSRSGPLPWTGRMVRW